MKLLQNNNNKLHIMGCKELIWIEELVISALHDFIIPTFIQFQYNQRKQYLFCDLFRRTLKSLCR